MKKLLLTLFLSIGLIAAYGQSISVDSTSLTFELPNKKWFFDSKQVTPKQQVYYYKREPIVDSKNRQVIPNIAFIVENNKKMNVIEFSILKRGSLPIDIKEVFSSDDEETKLSYKNAVGYKAIYSDQSGLEHTVFLIHIINGEKGIQLIMDITSELFPEYEKEFEKTLRSIQG